MLKFTNWKFNREIIFDDFKKANYRCKDRGKPKYPPKRNCPPKNGYRISVKHKVQLTLNYKIFEISAEAIIGLSEGPLCSDGYAKGTVVATC